MLRIYTGGTFDLFHVGHVNLLRRCRELAGENGYVVVSLNTDEFITRYKGKPPVYNQVERTLILQACRYVDNVILNVHDENSAPAIETVEPNYIVVGSDWAGKDYYKQMGFTQEWLDVRGIGLIYVPYTKNISSTEIKKKLK